MSPPLSSNERTPKDYAIEHAGYLATAAEGYLQASARWIDMTCGDNPEPVTDEERDRKSDALSDHRAGLESAIYEFRKRADRAQGATDHVEARLTVERGIR